MDDCEPCHGSGRDCFDIEVECGGDNCQVLTPVENASEWVHTLTVSVVPGMVLPIVVGACPDKTNAPHRRAHVHLAEPSDDDQGASGICHENCDLVFDSPWKTKNAARLPSAAAVGMFAVRLNVHTLIGAGS